MLSELDKGCLKFVASILGLITICTIAIILVLALVSNCHAQSSYPAYQQSTQETNRQYHQMEIDRQQRLILQQQYIQTQQLDQMRRDTEVKFNQSNRSHDHSQFHNPIRY